ncbi:MAG: hypothetical protein WCP12_04670 [bacterium]
MKAWLINSNSKTENKGTHCFEYMIRHSKVSAYYDGFNNQIDIIEKGDLVLLYHNKNRIIAVGFVVKKCTPHDYQHDMGSVDEHWADVNWIWKVTFDNDLTPLNPIIRTNVDITMVNKTVVNITDQLDYKGLLEEMASRQLYL